MKRPILTTLLLFSAFIFSYAQNYHSGIVCDRKGKPVPGASIRDIFSQEEVFTDMNGRYVIPTRDLSVLEFSHKGMSRIRTTELKDSVVLGKKWGVAPERTQFFLMPQISFLSQNISSGMSYGLMMGFVRKVGMYVKMSINPKYWNFSASGKGHFYAENPSYAIGHFDAGGGIIIRLDCPLHLYTGLSYIREDLFVQAMDGSYNIAAQNKGGAAVDLGIIFRHNNLLVSAGAQAHGAPHGSGIYHYFSNYTALDIKIGIGVCF